jgi:hypothetical protein
MVLLAACSSPATTSTPQTSLPTEIVEYSRADLYFEYPSEWRIAAEGDICLHDATYVAVGTGEWLSGCRDGQSGDDAFVLDRGEAIVRIGYFYSGPAMPAYEVPAFGTQRLESGLAASNLGMAAITKVFVPGHRALQVEARFGDQPREADVQAVRRLIESLDLDERAPASIITSDVDAPTQDCAQLSMTGRLARGDVDGPTLATGEFNWVSVVWPKGWRSRLEGDGRLAVVDPEGQVRVREWDEVQVGGRGDINEFVACPDAVNVLRVWGG